MAWRPYANLINGVLSNRVPGKVTGWMRFLRRDKKPLRVILDLKGDFHEDIRGSDLVLKNDHPAEQNVLHRCEGTYMEGFARVQRGTVGDITAGLPLGPWTEELAERLKAQLEIVWLDHRLTAKELKERLREVETDYAAKIAAAELYYPHVARPFIEWYADNGRVVLELDPAKITVIRPETPPKEKSPQELVQDRKDRAKAFGNYVYLRAVRQRRGKNGKITVDG